MLPTPSPAPQDEDSLAALLDSSRRLGYFWPPLPGGTQPGGAQSGGARSGGAAPGGPITVPARARELVAGLPEYGS
jgi:hypothetical protein